MPAKKPEIDKFTLITNLRAIAFNGMTLFAHALVLQDCPPPLGLRARGFKTSADLEVFDIRIPTTKYEAKAEGHGLLLSFGEGIELQLWAMDQRKEIDIQLYEAPTERRICLDVWSRLQERVEHYWDAPNLPSVVYTRSRNWPGR